MPRRNSSIFEILILMPWWCGLLAAGLLYFGAPVIFEHTSGNEQTREFSIRLVQIFAVLPLVAAALSAFRAWQTGQLLDRQTDLESLAEVPWKTFEDMMAEVFRRKGYSVQESLRGGADGGVDLVMRLDGKTTLVQCKRWKKQSVGVPIVRELFGIMTAKNAHAGILVTTAKMTKECVNFARGKSIQLIDGEELLALVKQVRPAPKTKPVPESATPPPLPEATGSESTPLPSEDMKVCGRCGSPMLLRTATRGNNVGGQFLGCSAFPKCRNTEAF